MNTDQPLHFGNFPYTVDSLPLATDTGAALVARPTWIPLSKDNWHLFDIARYVFQYAEYKQKGTWKLLKKGKQRAKRKSGATQRASGMDSLRLRNFTRQRVAVRHFNMLRDVAEENPGELLMHRKYLYDNKAR